jgi:WD40 repeat protein
VGRARLVVQARFVNGITKMSISKDGLLATTSIKDRSLKLWSLRDRALLRTVRDAAVHGGFLDVAWRDSGLLVESTFMGAVPMDLEGHSPTLTNRPSATWVKRSWGEDALPITTYRKGFMQLVMGGKTHVLEETESFPSDAVVIASDETHAASANSISANSRHVLVWPLTGADAKPEVVDLALTDESVRAIALGNKGDQLLVGVESRSFDFASGLASRTLLVTRSGAQWAPPRELPGPTSFMRDVRVSPDGSLAVAVGYHELVVFELPSGGVRWRSKVDAMRIGHGTRSVERNYESALFSPDGSSLVVARVGGSIIVFDARTGKLQGELGAEVRRASRAFFTSPTEIAAASDDRLTFWSATDGRVARTETVSGATTMLEGDILDSRVEPHSRCGDDGETMSLSRWEGTRAPKLASDDDAPFGDLMSLSPRKMDMTEKTKKVVSPLWPPARGRASTVCVPEKRLALSLPTGQAVIGFVDLPGAKEQAAFVVDLRSKKKVALVDFHKLFAAGPQITPDGAYVIATTGAGMGPFDFLVVWDAKTGRIVKRDVQVEPSDGSPKGVNRYFLSPDRKRILLVYNKDIAVFGFPDMRQQAAFTTTANVEAAVALEPTGETWLFGSADGTLFRVEKGAVTAKGASAGGALQTIELDPAQSRAVTVSEDGTLGIWDAKTASLRATFASFDDDEYISFTPGGAYAGTSEVSDRVGWVFDGPLEGFRFEQFERAFRKPDVVKARLAGAGDDASPLDARPPHVDVLQPPLAIVSDDVTEVRLRATSVSRVDAVRAFVEGRPVVAQAVCSATGEVTLKLPLMGGSNRVSIVAFDDRGFASNPAVFDVTVADSKGQSAPQPPELYVVAAGVSRYPRLAPSYQLDLAAADARSIAEAFSAQAGPAKQYAAIHSKLLVDEQVTSGSLKEALAGLGAMRATDTAVVFLAGHGVKPGKDADMVFLTSTADATPEGIRAGGLGWNEIGTLLSAAKGRVLVLLDACHSGDVSQELLVPNGDLAASLVHDQRAGTLVFAAAKGRQLSYEGQTSRAVHARGLTIDEGTNPLVTRASNEAHGFFTGAFLNSLVAPATDRNGDGVVQVSELIDDVIARVSIASDGKQTPWIARRELFGDFAIARVASPLKAQP